MTFGVEPQQNGVQHLKWCITKLLENVLRT